MTIYYNQYTKLYVAVDCIVFGFDEGKLKVLIGKRAMDPGRGEWSLYGGFVGSNESLNEAAERTLTELTGLEDLYMRQVAAFGKIDRDPGERVISVAYYALINVNDYSEDLLEKHGVQWWDIEKLPKMYSDHNEMVRIARRMMREKAESEPISFHLLPELFTLTQLQTLYECINGEDIDKRNFRKRVAEMDYIEKTDKIDKTGSKRGAALYKFNQNIYDEDPFFKLK